MLAGIKAAVLLCLVQDQSAELGSAPQSAVGKIHKKNRDLSDNFFVLGRKIKFTPKIISLEQC